MIYVVDSTSIVLYAAVTVNVTSSQYHIISVNIYTQYNLDYPNLHYPNPRLPECYFEFLKSQNTP